MGYILSEEQQFLADSAVALLKQVPVSKVRELRDNNDELGYSKELWDQMIEMGWPGLVVKEEFGGLDFGWRSLGVIMEESGRTLSASPLLSVAVSAKVIEKYGKPGQKSQLDAICVKGDVVALAIQEGDFFQPDLPGLKAVKDGNKWIINGTKDMVLDAHVAEKFIVSAHTDEGITLFMLNGDEAGISVEKEFMMDSRYYSKIALQNVTASDGQTLGTIKQGTKIINDIVNWTNALLSAELTGVMSEAFDRTIDYLKERRQFDKTIGSFQGLQHRAADLYGEIELAKSIMIKALDALDQDDFMAPAYCSMAKAKCIQVAQLATNEGVQMFGGIGMTDDEEIGFFLKRARVASLLFGGNSYHLDRFARMNGY